jgi:hypothetical protein
MLDRFDMEVQSPAFLDRKMINFLNDKVIMRGRNSLVQPLTSEEINEFKSLRKSSNTFISSEGLIGDAFNNMLPLYYNLDLMKALDSDIKIIIFIRAQHKLLASYYNYAVQEGYYAGIEKFLNYHNKDFQSFNSLRYNNSNVEIQSLDFYELLISVRKLFGPEKVLMLPIEMLRNDTEVFIRRLEIFCGAAFNRNGFNPGIKNIGMNSAQIYFLRIVNRISDTKLFGLRVFPKANERIKFNFFGSRLSFFERAFNKIIDRKFMVKLVVFWGRGSFSINKSFKNKIKNKLKESNLKLSEEIKCNLVEYDY